jgi:hypothetical protein
VAKLLSSVRKKMLTVGLPAVLSGAGRPRGWWWPRVNALSTSAPLSS